MIVKIEKIDSKVMVESSEGVFEKKFDGTVAEYLIVENRVLIRLNIESQTGNRNIFCLNERAEILWQIQDSDTYRPGLGKSEAPFTGMRITEDGKVRVSNWDSHGYDLDIETGKLSNAKWTK